MELVEFHEKWLPNSKLGSTEVARMAIVDNYCVIRVSKGNKNFLNATVGSVIKNLVMIVFRKS